MKYVVFVITWVVVFFTMENYFYIEESAVYAVVGYFFRVYQDILDFLFDKPL